VAFNPNQQAALVLEDFEPTTMLWAALNTKAPWDSIVDFATHDSYCGVDIFPRQATLLKLIFLETENMTAYDVEVIESWRKGMLRARDVFGVQPDIWKRVDYLKARGYRRFPHIQAILGRRASKGFIGGILGCEQIAFLHSLDNPQAVYGIDEGKDVYLNVGATSQTVAMRQMFADIRTRVERCKYFRPPGRPPWIAESKDGILRVRTPADLRQIAAMRAAKIPIDHQIASLCAVALSAASTAGRGQTSYGNVYDEFAFHVQTGSVKSDTQIYKDWQPSLGQFGIDALTYVPSSPATKVGMFHTLYQQGKILLSNYKDETGMGDEARQTLVNNGITIELDAEPTWLIFQCPSWGLYEDWQRAPQILGLGYGFPKAPEPDLTDERQIRERRRDPEKFKVEKEGQFAEVQGAYLDADKVDDMFKRPSMTVDEEGNPVYWRDELAPQSFGTFDRVYRMHCDPGKTGANFALAIGHLEDAPPDEHGRVWPHVVFDLLHVWRPMDFPEDPETHKQTIDYVKVHNDIEGVVGHFMSLEKISFDQWNSASFLASLKQKFSPGIRVVESTFSEKTNQDRFEKFKSALNLGWVHSYADNFYYDNLSCLLELELKFLSLAPNGKVIKQEVGPVVTKDLADCVMEVTVDLLHHALDRWSKEVMTAGAYGSSDVAALRSGRDFERQNEAMMRAGSARDQMNAAKLDKIRAQVQGRAKKTYQPDRTRSIHRRGR
jgi:hypothetical protein